MLYILEYLLIYCNVFILIIKMTTIIFTLPFPPSVNSKYQISKGKRCKSKIILAWEREAINALNLQNIQPVLGRVLLEYSLDTPDMRVRDAANYEKYVTDLLTSQGVLIDDSARYVKGIFTFWNDTKGDKITVKISKV